MTPGEIRALLEGVRDGSVAPATAEARLLDQLRAQPFEDLGFARVDHHRAVRQGFPEVILGLGKTPGQIAAIAGRIAGHGAPLIVTRACEESSEMSSIVKSSMFIDCSRATTSAASE